MDLTLPNASCLVAASESSYPAGSPPVSLTRTRVRLVFHLCGVDDGVVLIVFIAMGGLMACLRRLTCLLRWLCRNQGVAPAADQVVVPRLEQPLARWKENVRLGKLHQRPLHLAVAVAAGE
jgi:hypothetical protein